MDGLTPTEFFFHIMGGRDGHLDNKVKLTEKGLLEEYMISVSKILFYNLLVSYVVQRCLSQRF